MRLKRQRKPFGNEENHERWLLTYADLITLLLAFFIVMYSMSQVDAKRFGKIAEALNGVLRGGNQILKKTAEAELEDIQGRGILQIGSLRPIELRIQDRFKTLKKEDVVKTEITERGLVIHIMESALFKGGSASLEPKAKSVLDEVSEIIKPLPNHIRVEGHTDNRQISTAIYPSNWELSSARATEVVRYLSNNHQIPPTRISALGYGEYRPLHPNTSIENRAMNRRVDIVVLTMELTLKEPSSQLYGNTTE